MYSVGTNARSWRSGDSQTITFIVTDDCNLRCKYCYITHKSAEKRMRFETAQRFIDYILTSDIRFAEAVILDFIGGEPMLEAPLISQICDYFKVKAFELNHPWYWNYRINICTNGVNYGSKDVQALIRRNFGKISVSITLDGTKEKHDLQRVFPDGSGSYDAINQNIDLWLSQFRGTTKVTFASDDLPYLKDSIFPCGTAALLRSRPMLSSKMCGKMATIRFWKNNSCSSPTTFWITSFITAAAPAPFLTMRSVPLIKMKTFTKHFAGPGKCSLSVLTAISIPACGIMGTRWTITPAGPSVI